MIVCLTPPQMNDFGDLLGTPYAPVSKIAPVKKILFDEDSLVAYNQKLLDIIILLTFGVVHKLRLQILPIFDHLPTSVYIG